MINGRQRGAVLGIDIGRMVAVRSFARMGNAAMISARFRVNASIVCADGAAASRQPRNWRANRLRSVYRTGCLAVADRRSFPSGTVTQLGTTRRRNGRCAGSLAGIPPRLSAMARR